MKKYIVIEECLGTDGEFTSNAYPATSAQNASEICASLIKEMNDMMEVDKDLDPTTTTELEGDGWWFRVRIEEHES